MAYLFIAAVVILTGTCSIMMFYKLRQTPKQTLSLKTRVQLMLTGLVSFIADTIGIGSFVANTAICKTLGLFEDDELPGVCNGAQTIPGALSSIFFMKVVAVDFTMLFTLVAGTCVGGMLGGHFVSRLSIQKVRLCMMLAFTAVAVVLFLKNIGYFVIDSELTTLPITKLIFGFFAMMLCGALTAVGMGLFAMVQAVLFLMGVSPAVAFPIMTTAGAMQQPLTTMVFLKRDRIPLQKTLILSLTGCLGVLLALPVISHLNTHWLHQLLFVIIVYNIVNIALSYRKFDRLCLSES